MKTRSTLKVVTALLALSTFNPQFSTAFAQGSLTPPGAPGPTMKTLQQIEPRTPISSAPFTITNSGSYYLTANLNVTGGDAITISTNGVTLDLNGFTISSTDPNNTGAGIHASGLLATDITILNGHIRGGVTNNGGTYSGPGFAFGIIFLDNAINGRVSGVSVYRCLTTGIYLSGNSTVVESCTVEETGGDGIFADTVTRCTAFGCGGYAIYAKNVASDCFGDSPGAGDGINATTAINCVGDSFSGYGIYARTAQNCYGTSQTSDGVHATTIATGCYGYNNAGGGFDGVYSGYIANGCYGYSTAGTGLGAVIANVCGAGTSSGTAFAVTHNVNSF